MQFKVEIDRKFPKRPIILGLRLNVNILESVVVIAFSVHNGWDLIREIGFSSFAAPTVGGFYSITENDIPF